MALSVQDKEYFAEKLRIRSYFYLLVATAGIGSFGCPLLFYVQDSEAGQAGRWTAQTFVQAACSGFLIGVVISTVSYLTFRLLLEFELLPSRR